MTRSKYVGVEITPMAQVRIVIAQMEGTGDEISKAVSGVLQSFGARPVMQPPMVQQPAMLPPAPAQEQPGEEATVDKRRAFSNRGRAKQPATVVAQAAVAEPTSTGPSAYVSRKKSSAGGGVMETQGPNRDTSAAHRTAGSIPARQRQSSEPQFPVDGRRWNKMTKSKHEASTAIPTYTAPAAATSRSRRKACRTVANFRTY